MVFQHFEPKSSKNQRFFNGFGLREAGSPAGRAYTGPGRPSVAIRFVMVCAIRMWMSCLVHRIHGRESCFGTTLWAMTSESWTTMWAMNDMRTVNHDVAIQLDMVCAVQMWVSCLVHRIHGRGSCFVIDLWTMT